MPLVGKAHALNFGLDRVCTPHFITIDADTCLEKRAVQRIINHIVHRQSACVAGNLFVGNARGHIRLNLAMPRATVQTGLERIAEAIRKEKAGA